MHVRLYTLLKFKEERQKAKPMFHEHQQIIKIWFDKHLGTDIEFTMSDLVLKWDKIHEEKGKHSKFQHLWSDPFQIFSKLCASTYILQKLEGKIEIFPVNGKILKRYFS